MPLKLYESRAWLRREYLVNGLTPAQIAEKAGCSQVTIYRKLEEFGLKR